MRPKSKPKKKKKKKAAKEESCFELRTANSGAFWSRIKSTSFLPNLGRKFSGGSRKKTPGPHYLFTLLLFQSNTFQKIFPTNFLSYFFFILPKIHSTKPTPSVCLLRKWRNMKETIEH